MLIPLKRVEKAILVLRGQKVILDADLADRHGVATEGHERGERGQILQFYNLPTFQCRRLSRKLQERGLAFIAKSPLKQLRGAC